MVCKYMDRKRGCAKLAHVEWKRTRVIYSTTNEIVEWQCGTCGVFCPSSTKFSTKRKKKKHLYNMFCFKGIL